VIVENMGMHEEKLPDVWKMTKVGEVLAAKYGKALRQEERVGGQYPVYGSSGIVGYHNQALTKAPCVVIGRKGSIGSIFYSESPCWPIDTAYYIDDFRGMNPRYLEYAFRHLRLDTMDTSSAIPGLNRKLLYQRDIPIPPLPEQRRIVAKLDELMAEIKAAKAHLARAKEILKQFRQAVLNAAVTGKLTEEWRSYHPSALDKDEELPEGWKHAAVQELLEKDVLSYGILKPGAFIQDGVLMVRVMDIGDNGEVYMPQVVRVAHRVEASYSRTRLERDDVLLTIMATVGRVAVVPQALEGANVNRAIAVIRLNQNKVLPTFLALVFRSQHYQLQLTNRKKGSAQSRVNIKDLRKLIVPVPPLEEQRDIIRRVSAILARWESPSYICQEANFCLERVVQGLLFKALSGHLIFEKVVSD
jgi:type I restriction enzyme, S subunit